MDRMRLKRLLTICLALMLSVSMLPAGVFAAGDPGQDGEVLTETGSIDSTETPDSGQKDADGTETGQTGGSDDVNKGNDDLLSGDNNANQDKDMAENTAKGVDDQAKNTASDGNTDVDIMLEGNGETRAAKGDESGTSLKVEFDEKMLPLSGTHEMLADHVVTMVITATTPMSAGEKSITVDIPTGWAVLGCSALESDTLPVLKLGSASTGGVPILGPAASGRFDTVEKIKIDPQYQDDIVSVTLDPVTKSPAIESRYGEVTGDTWETQKLEGWDGTTEARTLGGRLTYALSENASNVKLLVHLIPQPFIFPRNGGSENAKEVMPPVVTTLSSKLSSSDEATVIKASTENNVTATSVARVSVGAVEKDYNYVIPEDDDKVHFPIRGRVSQWGYGRANYTWASLADTFTYTIEYPVGVFYSETQNGIGSDGSNLPGAYPGTISVQENSVTGGGTITITGDHRLLQHNNGTVYDGYRKDEFVLYFDAKAYNENVDTFKPGCTKKYGETQSPDSLTITGSTKIERLDTVQNNTGLKWTRNIYRPSDDTSYAIAIDKTEMKRRDLVDDFGLEEYDILLAHTGLTSKFEYNDVPFHFVNEDNKLGITGIRMIGKDIKDLEIKTFYEDDREGRTIKLSGPYGSSYSTDTGGSHMIAGKEIGLNDGEYISEVNLKADVNQQTYGSSNIGCGIGFMGQFLQDRPDADKAGKIDVSVVRYEDGGYVNIPAKSADKINPDTGEPEDVTGYAKVSVGMDKTGSGSCRTIVSRTKDGADEASPTWYPNEVVYFKSIVDSSFLIHEQDTLVDPVITIALPEGMVLNDDSVQGQSAAGRKDDPDADPDDWFKLTQCGGPRTITDANGVTWTCYDYKCADPLGMIACEEFTNFGKAGGTVTEKEMIMSVRFDAYVSSTCPQYSLDAKDCVLWYIGENTVSGNGGQSCVFSDEGNRMNRGTDVTAAMGTKQFYIKPLIGLLMDLAIRADESPEADWMTWAGGDNTVANVHEGKPATVKLSYVSTSESDHFKKSVIYLPIPKEGKEYTYLNNVELASPIDNPKTKPFEFTADLKGPITMVGDGTKWETLYATSATSNPDTYDSVDEDERESWEPVVDESTSDRKVKWYTAEELENAGISFADVIMVKFVAQEDIPPGKTGEAVFTMDIDPDARFGSYDYWRGYGKARLGAAENKWNYTPVIAATPTSATFLGQLFIDDDVNAAFDEDRGEQGYGENFTAILSKDDGTVAPMNVTVENDGSMKLLDEKGRQIYLRMGKYTLTVTNTDDDSVYDYEKVESDTKSSAEKWYNDIKNANISDAVAAYQFTVDKSVEKTRSRAAGNIKPVVYYAGVGLAKMNDFTFTKLGEIEDSDGSATNEPLAGVKFALYTDEDCKTPAERDGTAYEATSDAEGKVEFNGIVAGTYYMKETALPSGTEDTYFANNTTYRVVVDNEGKAELTRTVADPDTGETQVDEETGYSIVNRQKTSIEGIKIWNDGNETRPNITIILTKMIGDVKETAEYVVGIKEGEGVDIVADPDPDDSSKWSFTISDLAAFDENGNPILYSIAEDVLEGYIATQEGNTITNTKTTEATVKKVWLDGNDAAGKRPDELTFTLQQKTGSEEPSAVKDKEGNDVTVTLPSEGKWEASVKDLPKYDEDGAEITYSWAEPDVTGYELTDTSVSGTVTTFTNTILTEATVKKVWVDADDAAALRPASLKVTLMNGTTSVSEVMLDEDGGWEDTITDLLKYDAQGEEITYTWSEAADTLPDGYELTGTDKKGTVTTLTNTLVPHKVKVTKTFKGIDEASLPADFSIAAAYTEYVKGKGTAGKAATKELKLTDTDAEKSDDGLTYTWTIENVCYGSEFTATEAGYELKSYRHEGKVAASDTEAAGTEVVVTDESASGTIDKVPATDDAHIDFTNKYTHSDLWIYKTLPEYVQLDADNEENVHASFAFRIVGYKDEDCTQESGFNTVKGIEFDSASETEGKAFIGKIPKDVVAVKITEISMSGYEPDGDSTVTATRTVDADDNWIFRAEFANKRTGTPYESGVVNKYRKEGDTYAKGAAEIPEEPKEIVPPEEDRR